MGAKKRRSPKGRPNQLQTTSDRNRTNRRTGKRVPRRSSPNRRSRSNRTRPISGQGTCARHTHRRPARWRQPQGCPRTSGPPFQRTVLPGRVQRHIKRPGHRFAVHVYSKRIAQHERRITHPDAACTGLRADLKLRTGRDAQRAQPAPQAPLIAKAANPHPASGGNIAQPATRHLHLLAHQTSTVPLRPMRAGGHYAGSPRPPPRLPPCRRVPPAGTARTHIAQGHAAFVEATVSTLRMIVKFLLEKTLRPAAAPSSTMERDRAQRPERASAPPSAHAASHPRAVAHFRSARHRILTYVTPGRSESASLP